MYGSRISMNLALNQANQSTLYQDSKSLIQLCLTLAQLDCTLYAVE